VLAFSFKKSVLYGIVLWFGLVLPQALIHTLPDGGGGSIGSGPAGVIYL
jgi:hypothetical protein